MSDSTNPIRPAQSIDAILAQRAELKARDPDAILLFRADDVDLECYRAFGDDVAILREIVGGDLPGVRYFTAGRPGKESAKVPLGSMDRVLARIVAAGKRAAVVEPVAGPVPAGAEVERVVLPGAGEDDTGSSPSPAIPGHRITLGYTSEDDGVWLMCGCGFRQPLGFDPTIEEVGSAASDHRKSVMIAALNRDAEVAIAKAEGRD